MHYRGNKYNYKRPKVAHILGQLGVVLTWVPQQCWLQLQSGRGNVEGPGRMFMSKMLICSMYCPGQKPTRRAVKCPACPYKSVIQKRFTTENAEGA